MINNVMIQCHDSVPLTCILGSITSGPVCVPVISTCFAFYALDEFFKPSKDQDNYYIIDIFIKTSFNPGISGYPGIEETQSRDPGITKMSRDYHP